MNLPANAGDMGDVSLTPTSGRSTGEGNGNPLQYSCPEKSRVPWWTIWGLKRVGMTERLNNNNIYNRQSFTATARCGTQKQANQRERKEIPRMMVKRSLGGL